MGQSIQQIEEMADRANTIALNRYLNFIGNTDEEAERDVIDDAADDGDEMQGFVEHLIDDTHDLRQVLVQAARMHPRCTHKRRPLDAAEIGRLLLALVHPELDKYAEQEVEKVK